MLQKSPMHLFDNKVKYMCYIILQKHFNILISYIFKCLKQLCCLGKNCCFFSKF